NAPAYSNTYSAPFGYKPVAERNRLRVALHSICRTAHTNGTQCAHPAASSTTDLNNPIASPLRPSLRTSHKNHDLHAMRKPVQENLNRRQQRKRRVTKRSASSLFVVFVSFCKDSCLSHN